MGSPSETTNRIQAEALYTNTSSVDQVHKDLQNLADNIYENYLSYFYLLCRPLSQQSKSDFINSLEKTTLNNLTNYFSLLEYTSGLIYQIVQIEQSARTQGVDLNISQEVEENNNELKKLTSKIFSDSENDLSTATSISSFEYILYRSILIEPNSWKLVRQFNKNMTAAVKINPSSFWRMLRAFDLDYVIPFFSRMSEEQKNEVTKILTEEKNILDKDGVSDFVNALRQSGAISKEEETDSDEKVWQRAIRLMPDLQGIMTEEDYQSSEHSLEYAILTAAAILDFEEANKIALSTVSLQMRTVLKNYYRQIGVTNFSELVRKIKIRYSAAKGYDAETTERYTELVDELREKFGSDEEEIILGKLGTKIKGKKILDAGCGPGILTEILDNKGADVFGIDLSEPMIRIARERYPHLSDRFHIANISQFPFEDESFDVIVSKYVLNELRDLDPPISEFKRCLKHRGKLILIIHHPMSQMARSENPTDYFGTDQISVPLSENLTITEYQHQIKSYVKRLLKNGWRLIDFDEGQDPAQKINEDKNYAEMLVLEAIKM